MARVAIAPGMFLAQSVVPSSGSTAISTFGPALVPTFSPMKSIGASSSSPSPITTVPSMGSLLSSGRRDGRTLGHSHDFKAENAFQQQFRLDGNTRHLTFPSQTLGRA